MIIKKILTFTIILTINYTTINSIYSQNNQNNTDTQIKYLFTILKTSSNNSIRLKTIKELQNINSKKILEPIIFALNDKSTFIRIKCSKILANLNYTESINSLIRRLKIEKELFVQKEIILSLGKLKDQKARWIIKTFLKNKNITIKKSAKIALNMIENTQ